MPTTVRDRVNAMADKESNRKRGLLFEDRTGNDIIKSVDDDTHGYNVPAGVERGENNDTNEEHDAEDEENTADVTNTEREPTDSDAEIINNPPIEPAPIAIDVNNDDDNKTAGVEENDNNNNDNGVSDRARDNKITGVHEDDEHIGVSDNNVKTSGVQDNETAGVQNNNETTYHPNTTTPIDGIFNGLRKRKGK